MKPIDTLTTLFSHNPWANLRLLERCAELISEQLEATISSAFGSIRDTLQHIVTSEVINHATEHRAQTMAILTQLGIHPPDLDSWSYFDELEK